MVRRETAWLTRRRGDTSTACRRTVPWDPIRVESSRGPVLTIASTITLVIDGVYEMSRLTQYLDGVLLGDKVDNLECVLNDTDSHKLLSVVSAVHHEAENQL